MLSVLAVIMYDLDEAYTMQLRVSVSHGAAGIYMVVPRTLSRDLIYLGTKQALTLHRLLDTLTLFSGICKYQLFVESTACQLLCGNYMYISVFVLINLFTRNKNKRQTHCDILHTPGPPDHSKV